MNKSKLSSILILVKCCLCYGCSIGLVSNCFGIFLSPIATDLNFSIGSLSVVLTLRSLTTAVFSLLLAKLMKKYELRYLMSIGAIICVAMYCAMAFSTELWQFYLNGLLVGIGSCCFSIIPITCILQNYFPDTYGSVSGIVFAFSGIAGAVFNPIFSSIINLFSWKVACIVIGVMIAVLSLPCTLTFKSINTEQKEEKQNTLKEEKKMNFTDFVIMTIIASLFTIGTCLTSHISPLGISLGYDLSFSAKMVSAAMVGNIFFKLFMGYYVDKIGAFSSTVIGAMLTALGLVMLKFASVPIVAYLGSFLFGASFFCGAIGITTIVKNIAGKENYAEVYSKITVITSIISAASSSIIGFVYDYFNSYAPIIVFLSFMMILGSLLCIYLKKELVKKRTKVNYDSVNI